MRIAVAQPLTTPYDVAANAAEHAALVRRADADVVVFPELSLTGYHLDAEPLEVSDSRLDVLTQACIDTDTRALVGAPIREGEQDFIAMLAIVHRPSDVYHKMNLGIAEQPRFSPGDAQAALIFRDRIFGVAICKDTGVDAHVKATCTPRHDDRPVEIYVAGVLEHEHDEEVIATRAERTATTHDVWVAMASFAGSTGEGYGQAAGQSGIWRPDGSVAARAGRDPGEIIVAEIPDPRTQQASTLAE